MKNEINKFTKTYERQTLKTLHYYNEKKDYKIFPNFLSYINFIRFSLLIILGIRNVAIAWCDQHKVLYR